MSSTGEATIYGVAKVSGRSNVGGNPDTIANKVMSMWRLLPENGVAAQLFAGAVPPEPLRDKLKLRVWNEGGIDRGLLFVHEAEQIKLDHGKIVSQTALNHGSSLLEVVMEGNYLRTITVECASGLEKERSEVIRSKEAGATPSVPLTPTAAKVVGQVLSVPIRQIRRMKGQPRKHFDLEELQAFGENLKNQGQLQPAIVKKLDGPDENGCLYELISGERRWRSCQIAGIPELKVILADGVNNVEQFVQAVIANCHNVDLSLLETMESVGYLYQCHKTDLDIAKIFGKKSPLWAYQRRKALTLAPEVLRLLGPEIPEEKRLALNSAILLVDIPKEEQLGYAEMISETGMSIKQVHHMVKNRLAECGIARKNRSSDEFESVRKFFLRTNAEIELYVDHGDARITSLFKNRKPDQVVDLLKLVKDCSDNLGVVLEAFEVESSRSKSVTS